MQKEKDDFERCKNLLSDIKDAKNVFDKLAAEWNNDGISLFTNLSQKLVNAEIELEEGLESTKRKWWQIPFYSEAMSVEEYLDVEREKNKKENDDFKKIKKKIETISDNLKKELLVTTEIENNRTKLEDKWKRIQDLIKSLKKNMKDGFSKLESLKSRLNSISDSSTLEAAKPKIDLKKTRNSSVFAWAILSIAAVYFIPSNISNWSLLLSFGFCGIIVGKLFNFKKKVYAFLGGVFVAMVIMFLLPSRNKDNSESIIIETTDKAHLDLDDNASLLDNSEKGENTKTTDTLYDYIYSAEDNGWRKVEKNGKTGFIDENGNEIVKPIYDYIYSAEDNGWRKVEKNGKTGYIDENGKEIVKTIYDYIYSWSGGLAKVEKDGKTGYINREGKLVQPLE